MARILHADAPAVVLGSRQPEASIDASAARSLGVEVVRRRSGGGAVLVGPGQVLWVDLLLPAGDPLWQDDVGRAAWWVGDLWAAALHVAGIGLASVWKGPMTHSDWSAELCFAGLGPGEVTVDDHKVVGVSQRRTRSTALFQTAALLNWQPSCLLKLLARGSALDEGARSIAIAQLKAVAGGLGADRQGALTAAFTGLLLAA
jgi:lipoate-protein ligase A